MKLTSTRLTAEALQLEETLFHVANGYLGVRGCPEEGAAYSGSIRGCYIGGFYDTVELAYPERLYGFAQQAQRLINLPDIQTMRLFWDRQELTPATCPTLGYRRWLDTREGAAHRQLRYRCPGSGALTVTISRMASFVRPELFLTVMEIASENADGDLEIVAGVDCHVRNHIDPDDPRVASESGAYLFFEGTELLADGGLARCRTSCSGLELAICQCLRADSGSAVRAETGESGFTLRISHRLESGRRLTVEKHTVLSDSRRQACPGAHARQLADDCLRAGAQVLLAEQAGYLERFWEQALVEIDGEPAAQEAMEYNLFALLQSTGRDGITSVASKGLSGEGYEGHFFWDTEIYIFPFLLFTSPELARRQLDFRHSILDGARRHARLLGHARGALFPWRTITGSECSAYFPSGSAQYHLNGDVAHSFLQYWHATGDLAYMAKKGAEVLIETARLWLEVGHYDAEGRFCIHTVTGPDEYTCLVNNNYYTNRAAQHNLLGAAAVYQALAQAGQEQTVALATGVSTQELDAFERAAVAMLLPHDPVRDIHAQDDSFLAKPAWDFVATPREHYPLLLHYHPLYLYRHQVCKQADTVLAHLLFEDGVNESTMRNSYDYYERITTHDSSLSRCVFSIMAARLGMAQKAYDYFTDTLRTDLDNLQGNTRDGLHTANLGGSWLAVVTGFAGLRLHADGLHFRFSLPERWQSLRFRLSYRGSRIELDIRRQAVEMTLLEGQPVRLFVGETPYLLEGKLRLTGVIA